MSSNGNGAGAAASSASAVETAQAFVDAVVWGEHQKVWDLMGIEARTTVLKVASNLSLIHI